MQNSAPAIPRPGVPVSTRPCATMRYPSRCRGTRPAALPAAEHQYFRDPRWGRGQETYGEDPSSSAAWVWRSSRGCRATIRTT
jgi:hypothetical protein